MPGCWVVAGCCWDPDPLPSGNMPRSRSQVRGNSLAHLATAFLGFTQREDPLLSRAPTNPPARRLYLQPPTELGSTDPDLLAAPRLPRPCHGEFTPAPLGDFRHEAEPTLDQDFSKCRSGITTRSHAGTRHNPRQSSDHPHRQSLTDADFYRIISEMRQFYEFFITELLLHDPAGGLMPHPQDAKARL